MENREGEGQPWANDPMAAADIKNFEGNKETIKEEPVVAAVKVGDVIKIVESNSLFTRPGTNWRVDSLQEDYIVATQVTGDSESMPVVEASGNGNRVTIPTATLKGDLEYGNVKILS